MLNIIRGRAGSGKTEYLYTLIESIIKEKTSAPVFIVPEQFTFITERSLLKKLGAASVRKVKITGFSRLALSVLKDNSVLRKPLTDDGVKAVLMSKALEELSDKLEIFKKFKSLNSLQALLDFNKELKLSGLSGSELTEKIQTLDDGLLLKKLTELVLISETFDALVSQSYFDDTDALSVFSKFSREKSFFKGKTVFIDSFRSFSKPELDVFKDALVDADEVYISLCTDGVKNENTPFTFVNEFEKKLISAANELSVSVKAHTLSSENTVFSDGISDVEKNIYTEQYCVSGKNADDVTVFSCDDKEDECKTVACEIKKLLRSGKYRCREIAVIERNESSYKQKLINTFLRYGIPVFDDSKRELISETLFVYLFSAFDCINNGFTTDNVMRYLKSGISDLNYRESSSLEKYAMIWKVGAKEWQNDFTMNPGGFGDELNDNSRRELEELNKLREKAISPLIELKKYVKDNKGEEITKAVFEFCETQNVPERLFDIYTELNNDGFEKEASRLERSWDYFVSLIDRMTELTRGQYMDFSRWCELFSFLAGSVKFGEIPYGLDEVVIGTADRIRTSGIKVAFLVGVNQDEFPLVSVNNGILTDRDRRRLLSFDIELRPPFEKAAEEERFIVYCSLTAATRKLYLSYRKITDGAVSSPSELIEFVKAIIPEVKEISSNELSLIEKTESEASAFSALASVYRENTPQKNTFLKYFEENEEYSGKTEALNRAVSKEPVSFKNSEISKELFGKNIFISASKIEDFYKCRFKYFCKYGLKAKPLTVAELDPAQSGTVIHFILEEILKKYDKESFVDIETEILNREIQDLLSRYLNEKMGGTDNKSKRFMFLYNRLLDIVLTVFDRLRNEFKNCDFKPVDFELKIGGEKIPAYTVSADEGSVTVTGSVDRVDMYEKDGIKYLRVIDYKTGKKEFKLCKLLDGLNIQMVLYLMALTENGKDYYGKTLPSAVLYLPSRIGYAGYLNERNPDKDKTQAQKYVSGKLSGMILNSPVVLNACGLDKTSGLLPVRYLKSGVPSGNLYSLDNFKALKSKTDEKIKDMGNALHNGIIPVLPLESEGMLPCEYCEYRMICSFENGDNSASSLSLSHGEAIKILEGGEKNGLDS